MPTKAGARSTGGAAKGQTTPADAARIQATQAKAGNDTSKGGFPARAQAAAAKNTAGAPKTAKGGKST